MSTINENTIHIKLQINDEFRRFNVPSSTKYVELLDKIKVILGLDKDFTVKYKDDENEWITISTDIELETGLSFAKSSLLRLLVVVKGAHPSCPPSEGECGPERWRAKWRKRMEKWQEMHGEEGTESHGPHRGPFGPFGHRHGPYGSPFGHRHGPYGGPHHGRHWKKWAKWAENNEKEENGSEDCKKWKKRCRKEFNESDTVSCGEFGGHHGRRWKKDSERCRIKRGCKKRDEESGESSSESEKKRCPRKKFTPEEKQAWLEKRKAKRQERFQKKEENEKDEDVKSSGEETNGDELLSLEQIKKEIETLKVTSEKLREKTKESQDQLVAIRNQIKEKRSAGALDAVISLRTSLFAKKEEKMTYHKELKSTLFRIRKLTKLAATKSK